MTQGTQNDGPQKEYLVSLIAMSALSETEKELWDRLIPEMTDDEMKELIANMEAELNYEYQSGKRAGEQFKQILGDQLS